MLATMWSLSHGHIIILTLCSAVACFEQNFHILISGGDSVLNTTFCEDHIVGTTFCFMTHYDITMGNDIAKDVHCDIIIGHDIVMFTYHDVTMHADISRTLIYKVELLCQIIIFLFSY